MSVFSATESLRDLNSAYSLSILFGQEIDDDDDGKDGDPQRCCTASARTTSGSTTFNLSHFEEE